MSSKEYRESLSEIIRSHYPWLIRFIRSKWKGEETADDVLNDVVEKIFRRPNFSVPLDFFSSYLYRSISNRIIDLLRKKKEPIFSLNDSEKESSTSLLDLLKDHRYRPDRQWEQQELKELLQRALSVLTNQERAVIIENELHGIPFRLLAEEWDTSVGTLTSRKKRALEKMKNYLETDYQRSELYGKED